MVENKVNLNIRMYFVPEKNSIVHTELNYFINLLPSLGFNLNVGLAFKWPQLSWCLSIWVSFNIFTLLRISDHSEMYASLQVFDRLFSSFGQDILDSLFWTATEYHNTKREHFGVIPHVALALVYCCILYCLN